MHIQRRPLWARLVFQPLIVVATVTVAAIACILIYLVNHEIEQAHDNALRNGSNIVELFEQYLSRSIKSADEMLLLARSYYQRHQDEQDLLHWIRESGIAETALRMTMIVIDGKI